MMRTGVLNCAFHFILLPDQAFMDWQVSSVNLLAVKHLLVVPASCCMIIDLLWLAPLIVWWETSNLSDEVWEEGEYVRAERILYFIQGYFCILYEVPLYMSLFSIREEILQMGGGREQVQHTNFITKSLYDYWYLYIDLTWETG